MYIESTTTNEFKRYDISGYAHLTIINDSNVNTLIFSFDGNNIDGKLYPGETLELLDLNEQSIYLRNFIADAGVSFRMWVYGKQRVIYDKEKIQEIISMDSADVIRQDINFVEKTLNQKKGVE